MSRNGCLLLVCGLPSSGKTLLTNNLVAYCQTNRIQVCGHRSDLIIYKISIDELIPISEQSNQIKTNNGFWRRFRHRLRIAIKLFVNQLMAKNETIDETTDENVISLLETINRQNNISSDMTTNSWQNFVIIIDDNFYYKSMRYECFQTAKQFGLGFAIIMIDSDLDLSLTRNRLRPDDRRLPEDVIIKMSERFECPKAEGFEYRTHFVCADSFDCNVNEELIQFICDAIRSPVVDTGLTSVEEDIRQRLNTESKENLIHKIDCILRQIINEMIVVSLDKKSVAKDLNESKKCLLTRFRTSLDWLPQDIAKELVNNELNQISELDSKAKEYFAFLLNQRTNKN